MRFSEIWKTAFRAIGKNKRRSFLTMIGLVIGVSAVITIFSIGRSFEKYASEFMGIEQYDNSVGYYFVPSDKSYYNANLDSFTDEDVRQMESIPGVKDVVYDNGYGTDEEGQEYTADQTIDEMADSDIYPEFKLMKKDGSPVVYGRSIQESDNVNKNKVIVIDQQSAKAIRKENAETLVGQSITVEGQLFEVVGIMKDRERDGMMNTEDDYVTGEVPEKSYKDYFESQKQQVVVKLRKNANFKRTSKEIQDTLETSGSSKNLGTYKSQDLGGQVDQIKSMLGMITILVSAIGGISLFISGIGVMNMIYISVSERTKEIGVRRAMGGTKGNIMMQFLLEGITLTLIGGTVGYGFGMLFAYLISMFTPFKVAPDWFTVTLAFGLSVVIGIVFSWLPAKSASKKDIVALLR